MEREGEREGPGKSAWGGKSLGRALGVHGGAEKCGGGGSCGL